MNIFIKRIAIGLTIGCALFSAHLFCALFFAPEWAGVTTLILVLPIILLLSACPGIDGAIEAFIKPFGGGSDMDGFGIAIIAFPFIGGLLGACLGFLSSFFSIPQKWKSCRMVVFIVEGTSSLRKYFLFLGRIILLFSFSLILIFLVIYPLSIFGAPPLTDLVEKILIGGSIIIISAIIIYGNIIHQRMVIRTALFCSKNSQTWLSKSKRWYIQLIFSLSKLCVISTYVIGAIFMFLIVLFPLAMVFLFLLVP